MFRFLMFAQVSFHSFLNCCLHWFLIAVIGSYFITMLAFSVGLVSIFGVFGECTQFSNFESTSKKLFWIIFDPGKEEYTEIGLEQTECDGNIKDEEPKVSFFIHTHIFHNTQCDKQRTIFPKVNHKLNLNKWIALNFIQLPSKVFTKSFDCVLQKMLLFSLQDHMSGLFFRLKMNCQNLQMELHSLTPSLTTLE